MNFEQAHRLDNLHVSGTRVVFSKCAELAAQNIPVTALTLGEPDFSTPQYIVDACKRSLDAGQTRYTDGSGILELKEAVCEKLARENGLHYTPAEISVTTGVAQGMFVALLSTLNPGDEVLVPDPVYLTYSEIPNIAGAVIKKYNLLEENDYQVQIDEVRSLITEKTKMLVIVSPSNPTGGAAPQEMIEPMNRLSFYMTAGATTFVQYAGVAALHEEDGSIERMRQEFKRRRDYLVEEINKLEHFSCKKPEGAFYIFMNIRKTGMTSAEFCSYAIDKYRLALIPGDAFGANGEGYARLSYASSMEVLEKAIGILQEMDRAL